MPRLTPGVAVHFVDRDGEHKGAHIARVHEVDPEKGIYEYAGTCDLVYLDPVTLCPQPARLVPYLGQPQGTWDGTDPRWSWHWIEER